MDAGKCTLNLLYDPRRPMVDISIYIVALVSDPNLDFPHNYALENISCERYVLRMGLE